MITVIVIMMMCKDLRILTLSGFGTAFRDGAGKDAPFVPSNGKVAASNTRQTAREPPNGQKGSSVAILTINGGLQLPCS
jgi:hypothetical protein